MLEGIATSDFHLDGLNKHFIDANDRIFAEWDKICQYALAHGIKHIFIPGDMSDTPLLDWDTYTKLFLHLKKYDGILYTYYMIGNHDVADSENTSMNFLNTLAQAGVFKTFKIYMKPKREVIDGVPVNFIPWYAGQMETLSKGKEGALNFAHVEYTGAIGDNGRTLKTKHELITHKNDYTISGHIHQYQVLNSKRALYCGNPFQKNFGEELPKGFVHFKAELKGNKIEFQHKRVDNKPNFTLQNVIITDINQFQKLEHSDSVRYKLHVNADVPIPSDLMLQYPNITGGIWIHGQKKKESAAEEVKITKTELNMRTGLKKFLGAEGLDKDGIKAGIAEVKKAQNTLGFK